MSANSPRKRTRQDRDEVSNFEADDSTKLSKSCDTCKSKKIKCDGVKPRCTFCLKNGFDKCTYSQVKKPGLKPGYGKGMVQRMDFLENELQRLHSEVQDLRSASVQPSQLQFPQQSPSNTTDIRFPASSSTARQLPQQDTPTPFILPIRPRNPPLQIPTLLNPEQEHRFALPSESQCLLLIELFFSRVAPIFPLLHQSMAKELSTSVRNLQKGTEPPIILYAIVLISLKFLNSDQMSAEHKRVCYNACKETIISSALRRVNIESLQSMILLAYESLSGTVKVPEAWNYVSIAADYAAYLKLGTEKAIRVSFVTGDSPESNTSVHSTGDIARRKSKSISNRSLNLLRRPKDWIDEESRRHCFWCIYILDKIFAISSSHEMKLKSYKITSLLPLKLSYWNTSPIQSAGSVFHAATQQNRTLRSVEPTPRGDHFSDSPQNASSDALPAAPQPDSIYDSFAYYIELSKVVGDIHTFLIEEFNIYNSSEVMNWRMRFKSLENQLFTWVAALPPRYHHFLETGSFPKVQPSSPGGPIGLQAYDCLLFVYYYTSLIKLHSSFGYPHGESEHFKASEDSKIQCLDSVNKVFNFVHSLPTVTDNPSIYEKLGPHFGFFIWVNSRILFVNVIYQSTNNTLDPTQLAQYQKILDTFSDVLFKVGCFWESSMVYYKILQFLNTSDLSYVSRFTEDMGHSLKDPEEGDSNSDEEDNITGEAREPAKVFSDMRIGSHSLLFWFNKLASKGNLPHQHPITAPGGSVNAITPGLPKGPINHNSLFENQANISQALSNFQTTSALNFDEFQLTHDDFFNFLAMDINGSGSFQDMR